MGANTRRDGYPALTEYDTNRPNSGLGEFLNRFFALPAERLRELVAPLNLIRAGTPGLASTIDETLSELVKALDALCEIHGFGTQNLMEQLDGGTALAVQQLLLAASAHFASLREQCRAEQKLSQLAILDRIRDRQSSAGSKDRHFGVAVTALLEHFELVDAMIMNSYYGQLPNRTTWEGLLSAVRGDVLHSGALSVDGTPALRQWMDLACHLHDLCKRLIMKEVGYKGTYTASNVPGVGIFEVDRITPEFTVRQLGYTIPPDLAHNQSSAT
jgi:hypothetical protein